MKESFLKLIVKHYHQIHQNPCTYYEPGIRMLLDPSELDFWKEVSSKDAGRILYESRYNQQMLANALQFHTHQYVVFQGAYDHSFAAVSHYLFLTYRIDEKELFLDEQKRMDKTHSKLTNVRSVEDQNWTTGLLDAGFHNKRRVYVNAMGLFDSFGKEKFEERIEEMGKFFCRNSTVVLDYRNEEYSYREIEQLLSRCGFYIYEQLGKEELEMMYQNSFRANHAPHTLYFPQGISIVLAVKKYYL